MTLREAILSGKVFFRAGTPYLRYRKDSPNWGPVVFTPSDIIAEDWVTEDIKAKAEEPQKDQPRRSWKEVHSERIVNAVESLAGLGMPQDWPKVLSILDGLTIDEKFEILYWYASRTYR